MNIIFMVLEPPRELEVRGFIHLLGKTSTNGVDLSGESGELSKLKIVAKRNSYSKGVWMESTGGEW